MYNQKVQEGDFFKLVSATIEKQVFEERINLGTNVLNLVLGKKWKKIILFQESVLAP